MSFIQLRKAVFISAVLIFCHFTGFSYSNSMIITSHDQQMIITDPSRGFNAYNNWAVFPGDDISYRKIVLYITYECPDGLHCGEWDYIDNIYLRRIGSADSASSDIEIARMISPYGWRFDEDWKFTWHVDITDFGFLLRDSVEVEFRHGGWENNTDRGWLVTLDFEITEGKPVMECLGMEKLWNGNFAYGDSSKPIEKKLQPIAFENKYDAGIARLRILQTGHGMDDHENCAEFCRKYREVYFDDSLHSRRYIWRECGDNPLYPQAGTWIFDRANWCPGAVVYPDVYDFNLGSKETHTVDIEMEPYVNPSKPSASYHISSYLFYYEKPQAVHDVSIEEIIAPSDADEYSRVNPICANPQVVLKNNGRDTVRAAIIKYGPSGAPLKSFKWRGELLSQQEDTLSLPGKIDSGHSDFIAKIELLYDEPDEYPADNIKITKFESPPVYGPELIVAIRTNNEPSHNSYSITDADGNMIFNRALGSLAANTEYRDTFNLSPGCYKLAAADTAGEGLDFWFNPDGGYGYVRLLDKTEHLIKSFNPDFGHGIEHSFYISDEAVAENDTEDLPILRRFPPRNDGKFVIDFFENQPRDLNIKIYRDNYSRLVLSRAFSAVKDSIFNFDISSEEDGIYIIEVSVADTLITRKIKVQHPEREQ
ncbi:MAG: peptide-N-glycosidase [candidate division Zixibacteria bacterium]|nr:peptide-N-glycosidase [candidate division Zixibacteria bacterium]